MRRKKIKRGSTLYDGGVLAVREQQLTTVVDAVAAAA